MSGVCGIECQMVTNAKAGDASTLYLLYWMHIWKRCRQRLTSEQMTDSLILLAQSSSALLCFQPAASLVLVPQRPRVSANGYRAVKPLSSLAVTHKVRILPVLRSLMPTACPLLLDQDSCATAVSNSSQPVQMVGDTDGAGLHAVRDTTLELKRGWLSLEDSRMALAGEEMVMVRSRKRSAETIYADNECNAMNPGVKRLQVQQVR